jgi:hypothetical protein
MTMASRHLLFGFNCDPCHSCLMLFFFFSHLLRVFAALSADHSMDFYLVACESLVIASWPWCVLSYWHSYKVTDAGSFYTPSRIPLSNYLLHLTMAPKTASKSPSKSSRLLKTPRCVLLPEISTSLIFMHSQFVS